MILDKGSVTSQIKTPPDVFLLTHLYVCVSKQ